MASVDINLDHNFCRLCLTRFKGEVLKVSIFEPYATSCHSSIPVKIKTCVCIDVHVEDIFPQYICHECHNKLDDFFAFKQVCSTADLKLKTLLLSTAKCNRTTDDCGALEGSKSCEDLAIQSMPSWITISPVDLNVFRPNTIKTEPYSEEYGMAEAMDLDAFSSDRDEETETCGEGTEASTSKRYVTTEHIPIQIVDTFSLTQDNQRIHEIEVKVEPGDVMPTYEDSNTATTEMVDQDLCNSIKTETTEQDVSDDDIPLAYWYHGNRKIISVNNINDEEPSRNVKYNTLRRNYRCETCIKSFRRLSDLEAHHCANLSRTESKQPAPYRPSLVCPRCDRRFLYGAAFQNHVSLCVRNDRTEEDGDTKTRPKDRCVRICHCDVCGLTFQRRGDLVRHRAKHSHRNSNHGSQIPGPAPIREFVACGVTFPQVDSTTQAVPVPVPQIVIPKNKVCQAQSSNSQTFLCEPCDLKFQHKGALICHQAFYHRAEMNKNVAQAKYFTCEVCHVVFSHKDRYIFHKELHKYDSPGEGNGLALNEFHHFLTGAQITPTQI